LGSEAIVFDIDGLIFEIAAKDDPLIIEKVVPRGLSEI
jgi:hypothetical protein